MYTIENLQMKICHHQQMADKYLDMFNEVNGKPEGRKRVMAFGQETDMQNAFQLHCEYHMSQVCSIDAQIDRLEKQQSRIRALQTK